MFKTPADTTLRPTARIVSVDVSDSDDTLNSYSAPLPQFDEGGSAR